MSIEIERVSDFTDELGKFIDQQFCAYAEKHGITVNYQEFCFLAKDGEKIVGVITGHSYYRDVHIGDLIVMEECRGQDVGTRLVRRVEEEFAGKGYENINLTTYAFQAPEFYKKLGYEVEYVRKSADEKLTKYFLIKKLA